MTKIPFISRNEFAASLHYGCHYEGLVDTIGHVSWGKIYPRTDHPSFPNDRSPYFFKHTDFVGEPVYVPLIVPEHEVMKLVEVPDKQILDSCMRQNPDGTITVTLFDGREVTVGSKNSRIGIRVDDEMFGGQMERVVTLEVKDQIAGIYEISKTTVKDAIRLVGDNLTYASFITGSAQFRIGKHVDKMLPYREITTIDGHSLTGMDPYTGRARSSGRATNATKYRGMKVTTAAKVARGLKGTGVAFGIAGLTYTGYQYFVTGEISTERAIADAVFGTIGFAGVPGMVVSTAYFIWISPEIDKYSRNYRELNKKEALEMLFPRDLNKWFTLPVHNPPPEH